MGLLKELPITERPREKAFLFGIESLTNSELIAVLIGTGNKNEDVLELSHKLIKISGSLENLSLMSLQELCEVKGIKKAKAIKLKAAIELHIRLENEKNLNNLKVNDIHQGALILKNYFKDTNREEFVVLLLDKLGNVIGLKTLSIGSMTSVIMSPNILFTSIIKSNAKAFIIAHNHPSNHTLASKADEQHTSNLIMISSILGIKLMDHLIITDSQYYSILQKEAYYFK